MLKHYTLFILICLLLGHTLSAQGGVAINTTGGSADNSAMLDVKSNNKGMLIPRVSTLARNTIPDPAAGLMVYDTTERTLYMFDGARWLGFQAMPDNIRPVSNLVYAPDNQDTLLAGYCVSISDEFAAIGAPYREEPNLFSGGVYMYRKIGANWEYFSTLTPGPQGDTALFGTSVNISGNYMIVGAPGRKAASGTRVGAAYIYFYNGTSWVNTDIIYGSAFGTDFATLVDINNTGNYAVISEPGANAGAVSTGGVIRVYNKGFNWFLQATLQDPSPQAGARFGTSMAMSPTGTYIIAASPTKNLFGNTQAGSATIFKRSGILWVLHHDYGGSGSPYRRLGEIVDITDQHVLFVNAGEKKAFVTAAPNPVNVISTISFDEVISSACLDPVTHESYFWVAPSIYRGDDVKVKTISTSEMSFGSQNMFAVYNKQFALGAPTEQSPAGNIGGGFYLGVVNY